MTATAPRLPAAAVHLDMDGAPHIFRAHGWSYRADHDPLFCSGLRAFLDFFARQRLHATLFVIAEDLRDPAKLELLEEAVSQGHSIGSHTISHRHLTGLDEQEQRREIHGSRELLGERLGGAVAGFRAPGFDIDRGVLELVDEAGYAYDSSLFPGRPRRHASADAGGDADPRAQRVAAASAAPHPPLPGRRLLELPMPAHAPLPLPFHASYSLVLGFPYFRLGLRRHRRTGAPLVVLFHLTDLAEPLPPEMLAGRAQRVYTLSHLSAAQKRVRCERLVELVRRHYSLGPTESILQSLDSPRGR